MLVRDSMKGEVMVLREMGSRMAGLCRTPKRVGWVVCQPHRLHPSVMVNRWRERERLELETKGLRVCERDWWRVSDLQRRGLWAGLETRRGIEVCEKVLRLGWL